MPTTFQKRQKEMKRLDKQKMKPSAAHRRRNNLVPRVGRRSNACWTPIWGSNPNPTRRRSSRAHTRAFLKCTHARRRVGGCNREATVPGFSAHHAL